MTEINHIEEFENAYEGEPCFVIGNGPSLLDLDWEKMQGVYTFATNRIGALWNHTLEIDWRPIFYVLTSNQMVARKSWVPDCVSALESAGASFVNKTNRKVIPEELHGDIWWLKECRHEGMNMEEVPDHFFSVNPALWLSKFGTSWLPMMQLAVWMGFDPIYIVGCDLDFTSYDNRSEDDPNHFFKNYDGDGYSFSGKTADIVMQNVPAAHRLVKRVTEQLGIEVYNATPGGMDIWPRVKFEELF